MVIQGKKLDYKYRGVLQKARLQILGEGGYYKKLDYKYKHVEKLNYPG